MHNKSSFNRREFIKLSSLGMFVAPDAVKGSITNAGALTFSQSLHAQQSSISDAVVEDFNDIVTTVDLGVNDFSGNTGTVNSTGISGDNSKVEYGQARLVCADDGSCFLRFEWDFSKDQNQNAFTGLFISLFGLTDTEATFDGTNIEMISFPEHSLDFDRVDGVLAEPGGPRRFDMLKVTLGHSLSQKIKVRLELTDVEKGGRFTTRKLKPRKKTYSWDFRDPLDYDKTGERDLDLHRIKALSIIIERNRNSALSGSFDIFRIWFTPSRPEIEPTGNDELLDLCERRAAQYFLDWSSRKLNSFAVPQDRSSFGDLLTVGGVGFGLPAYVISAERGWIPRSEAVMRVLSVLRIMSDSSSFGPEPKGRIGHRGWFYHFLGTDGRRKLNFDFPDSGNMEDLNTVELSSIDTGLALMGVLAAQSYFDRSTAEEGEIRALAQRIYDNVDWPFMLEPTTEQFFLGWMPNEMRQGPAFEIPDAVSQGKYSGIPGDPATLDFYTDEAFIVTLLALGSTTHPVPVEVHCAWVRERDAQGLVRTFPGSLFTYQFLHAFIDTKTMNLPACPNEEPVDWYMNSQKAMRAVIAHVLGNRHKYSTYGPNVWGLSACEGPDDRYRAYGAMPAAINQLPEEDGTITYYAMMSAASFGSEFRELAIQALRAAWQRGHWHYRFGLPDAFHDEISQANLSTEPGTNNRLLRQRGAWVQRALFAIDQGPMLLHLENARSGLIWRLLGQNPNMQRALNRLRAPDRITLEAEDGTGQGQIMTRSNASGQRTVWLQAGESRRLTLRFAGEARYSVSVRYSNDNFGPLEVVEAHLNGSRIGQFFAQDTGDFGLGWNVFQWSQALDPVSLQPGTHELTVAVSGGDGFEIEIDAVRLDRIS